MADRASAITACVSSDDNPVSPDETQPSVGFSVRSLDITDCISTDKIFLLEFDEHGKATGRYNLFALPI